MKLRMLIAAVICGLAMSAQAAEFKSGSLTIENPWARASTGPIAGAFLVIHNNGGDADRLVGVSSEAAGEVQMHRSQEENGVVSMRRVEVIEVPAHGEVALKPGSYHIMLMGLKAPLKAGDTVPLTLKFEKAGPVAVTAVVQSPAAAAPGGGMMDHQHMMDHSHQ